METKADTTTIEEIIAQQAPDMRVIKRKRKSHFAQPDAHMPQSNESVGGEGLAADAGEADDDVAIVNVEPKSGTRLDAPASAPDVFLVSKSKKKIIARRG
jgi:hypothetical protein